MTVYEANKLMYQSVKQPIENFDNVKTMISEYLSKFPPHSYYMLLCKEVSYYTLFVSKSGSKSKLTGEILDIARDLGPIKDIIVNDNNAIEFWIEYDGETRMFVLFNYNQGVVEV